MCLVDARLYKFKNTDSALVIADEDVKVFKIVMERDGRIYSLYRNFRYVVGDAYSTKVIGRGCIISEGFHSYITNGGVQCIYRRKYKEDAFEIVCANVDLDYFTSNDDIYPIENIRILWCTIPKGGRYWMNSIGECVSDSIRIDESERLSDLFDWKGRKKATYNF